MTGGRGRSQNSLFHQSERELPAQIPVQLNRGAIRPGSLLEGPTWICWVYKWPLEGSSSKPSGKKRHLFLQQPLVKVVKTQVSFILQLSKYKLRHIMTGWKYFIHSLTLIVVVFVVYKWWAVHVPSSLSGLFQIMVGSNHVKSRQRKNNNQWLKWHVLISSDENMSEREQNYFCKSVSITVSVSFMSRNLKLGSLCFCFF